MRLKTVFIRFYKSFNYDYFTPSPQNINPQPWQLINNLWYPYLSIDMDEQVTTIVGANESGKSHFLTAIEKALSGVDYENNPIEREDFCRYSQCFFDENIGLGEQELRYPDFGTYWINLTEIDQNNLKSICSIPLELYFDSIYFFRENKNQFKLYIESNNGEYLTYPVKQEYKDQLLEIFPQPLRINSQILLPDRFSIKQLLQQIPDLKITGSRYEFITGKQRAKIRDSLDNIYNFPESFKGHNSRFQETKPTFDYTIEAILDALKDYGQNYEEMEQEKRGLDLVYRLLCQVAQINPSLLSALADALINGQIGYSNGLIEIINKKLNQKLNFADWWGQDQDFQLLLSPRDHDLVFTIKDRTQTQYALGERSSGLKYFLSYYIQYQAYQSQHQKPSILLMDEPDAYLSSRAQQDLLKILESFALDRENQNQIQVIYVTHSPFFINRNHPERVRFFVKEKQGTRILIETKPNDELLQEAIGNFKGEIFKRDCLNLIVNSIPEKILLAGMAIYLHQNNCSLEETLDLNKANIITVDDFDYLPGLIYFNQGPNLQETNVIIFLNQREQNQIIKQKLIKQAEQSLKFFELEKLLVTNISYSTEKLRELEDLIPVTIAVKATRFFLINILGLNQTITNKLTENLVKQQLNQGKTLKESIKNAIKFITNDQHTIDNFAFNRIIIDVINDNGEQGKIPLSKLKELENNFKILFREIIMEVKNR